MKSQTIDRLLSPWTRSEIREALLARQIVPYFQPKVDLETNQVIGAEALARWTHPTLGNINGELFIGAIERLGMVDELTDSMFHQVLACVEGWRQGGQTLRVAVNFSPETLQKKNAARRIKAAVDQYDVNPGDLIIEVTETAPTRNCARLRDALCFLRSQDFGISADDFGTGYSGLQQLRELPYTEIKIDRSFIAGTVRQSKSLAILEAIVCLADKLRIPTVAEGIESVIDSELAKSIGCTIGQGFLLGRPMSSEKIIGWMTSHSVDQLAVAA